MAARAVLLSLCTLPTPQHCRLRDLRRALKDKSMRSGVAQVGAHNDTTHKRGKSPSVPIGKIKANRPRRLPCSPRCGKGPRALWAKTAVHDSMLYIQCFHT